MTPAPILLVQKPVLVFDENYDHHNKSQKHHYDAFHLQQIQYSQANLQLQNPDQGGFRQAGKIEIRSSDSGSNAGSSDSNHNIDGEFRAKAKQKGIAAKNAQRLVEQDFGKSGVGRSGGEL